MNIGFTGTRHGATAEQLLRLDLMLSTYAFLYGTPPTTLHHGASPLEACADWSAERLARRNGLSICRHPPRDRSSKAMMERNQRVVDQSDILIACPREFCEVLRSGTWATVRRARKKGIGVNIIWPDGTSEWEPAMEHGTMPREEENADNS